MTAESPGEGPGDPASDLSLTEGDATRPRAKPTPGAGGAKARVVTMASRSPATIAEKLPTTPTQGRKPSLRQTRSGSRGKPVQSASSMSQEATPSKDGAGKPMGEDDTKSTAETTGGGAGDGVQRNLSLEALFQVTHSELKNIHRSEDDPVAHSDDPVSGSSQPGHGEGDNKIHVIVNEVTTEGESVKLVSQTPVQTPEPSTSLLTTTEVITSHEMDGALIVDASQRPQNELQIYVEVPQSPPEATVEVEMVGEGEVGTTPNEGKPSHTIVKLPASDKRSEKIQLKSPSLEEQGLRLTYIKKTYDQYEPNPISYGTYKPRSYKPTSQVIDPVLQETGAVQVGRKRKHPAKPGRHICQYCGRGCTKPSVLQKHIRAHTGERPYPCIPCGFSFKTKSNLYKHCKSRAHAIKAGLNPSLDDASKDSNKSREESFGDEELESDDMGDTEGMEEGGTSDSSLRDMSSRSTSVETGENSQPGSSFESTHSLSKEEVVIQKSDAGDIVLSLDLSQQPEDDKERGNSTPHLVRSSRVFRTDKQFFDVYVNKRDQLNRTASPEPSPAHGNVVVNASPRALTPASSVEGLAITSTVHKEADNSMKVTIKYPKVTKQAAVVGGSMDMKYLTVDKTDASGSNFRRSASLPEHPPGRQTSVNIIQSTRDSDTVPAKALREKLLQLQQNKSGSPSKIHSVDKNITKEMVGERINQLISDNAAVLALPMADAPRPKRVSRQNSEVKEPAPTGTQRGVLSSSLSLDSGANRPQYKGNKNITLVQGQPDQVHFLSQAEPTDQPPGKTDIENQSRLAELVAAAKTATPVPAVSLTPSSSTPLPQEFKIEFKLAKAATTDASAVTTPRLSTASAPVMVQNVQQLIAQPSVVLPPQPGMLTRQLSLPITQPQSGAQSSIIRDLLLKGQDEQGNATSAGETVVNQQAPTFQMVEVRADGTTSVINDLTQVVVVDSKGTPTTAYMAPTTQDPVAMNVAQDVEVVATVPFQRTQLKRTMSLPQGLPTASGSSSPYGNLIYENYDPKVPLRRGRPKGSKNRVREQLSLNIPQTSGTSTPEIYTSAMRMPLISNPVSSQVFIGSPVVTPTRPPLKLTIPPPGVSLSSQSTGSSLSTGTPILTGSTLTPNPDTPNTQSLTKLKLKGKLLMKRSMSDERMLSQEREKLGSMDESLPGTPAHGISSPAIYTRSGSTLTPTSYLTSPLQRTASADEVSPLKKRRAAFQQARSEDSSIRRLLGHQSTDSSLQSFSTSVETPIVDASGIPLATPVIMASSMSKPGLLSTTSQEVPDRREDKRNVRSLVRQDSVPGPVRPPIKLSPLAMAVPTTPTIVIRHGTAPTNQYQPIMRQDLPIMAPFLKLGRQEALNLSQSIYLSLKLSAANSLLAKNPSGEKETSELNMSTKTCLTLNVSPPVTSSESVDLNGHERKIEGEPSEAMDVGKDEVIVLPRAHSQLSKSSSSGGGSLDSNSSLGKPLSEKALTQVLLMGHQCPALRMQTHTTFCTLAKPQPMYVPQETSKKLSMYSNWQSARYNPNPMGLSSRELMSLYHLRLHDNEPFFTAPTMGPSKTGVLTHSSYWNYYNKMRSLSMSDDDIKAEDEVRTIKQVPEVKMATGVKIAEEEEKMIQVCTPNIAMETTVVTTPVAPKQKPKEPKRLKIFAGGYKTNEEYVYIRGRGRGKYVCEECGIRCKKPSMLRKHIRTHTDVRPYLCQYCNFSFKTKGNLTKHMKSKAHQKKCTELGIVPVPVTVEDSQIDPEALALQAQMARDGRTPSEDDDGQDEDDEDDGEEEEMEEDDDEETVMLVDAATGETKETIKYRVVQENPDGPQYVAIQDGNSNQPTLVMIESTPQAAILQHIKQMGRHNISNESVEGEAGLPGQEEWDNDQPRPSIDKEIAHSLLDLSKGNEPKKSSKGAISLETRRLLRQHSAHAAEEGKKEKERKEREKEEADAKNDGTRLDTLIGALMSRTKGPNEGSDQDGACASEVGRISAPLSRVRMATSVYQGSSAKTSQGQITSSDLQHIHKRSHNTYAQKIAALQSANENDLKMTMERSKTQPTGSGFVPPVFKTDDRTEALGTPGGIRPNKTLLRRQPSVGGLGDDKPMEPHEERPMNLSLDKEQDVGVGSISQANVTTTVNTVLATSNAQAPSVEKTGSLEVLPTPGKSIEMPAIYKDGKYICPICDKYFAEYSQYAYHKNIHYIERPFKCEECSLSFRTMAALQKHQRSEIHHNKQNVNQQFGVTKDNPRPFKCEDCNIAFRIHGHLVKHMRSKSHVQALERLGKAVPETSAESDMDIVEDEEEGEPMEVDGNDVEVSQVISKGSNITNALKDPENILQPRETTPTPQGGAAVNAPTGSTGQKEAPSGSPESDQFHYHKLSDYEKDFNASNENVTVEKIKMEPIDIGAISSFGTQPEGETEGYTEKEGEAADKAARNRDVFRHQASTGSTEQHPHKCGICGRTFKAITTLKQHLVTHAELRPYVCEYCDAGFTTAQSLKFHLRTHTQERPYICGQCGDTFARSDHLRNHMHSHEDDGEIFPSQPPQTSTPKATRGSVQKQPSVLSPIPAPSNPPQPQTQSVSAASVYQTIKPKPPQVQMLRPAQGQLIRSSSADPHVLRDIQPKVNEGSSSVPGLTMVRDTAAQRRLAFTSSLSLPIQSGAVQLVSVMPDSPQIVPQPLGVMRMPLLSMPAPSSGAFSGQLQTVLTPSSSAMQTLFISGSPVMLSSMPIIQQVQTAPVHTTKAISSPVVTTPTITITTPTKVTVNAEDHDGIMRESSPAPPDPVLIPTVVLEKEEEEEDIRKAGLQAGVMEVEEQREEEEEVKFEPGEIPQCVLGPSEQDLVIEEQARADEFGQVSNRNDSSGVPPEVISDAALSDTIRQNASSPLPDSCLPCDGSDAAAGSDQNLQPEPASSGGATHQDTGSRMLATKLIPGDDHAQDELVHLIEQQGLSLDKVQVLQVKDSEESTQFVIIESDDNDKVDAHAIAELVNQHKRSKASPPSAASECHSEMDLMNPDVKGEEGEPLSVHVPQANGERQEGTIQPVTSSPTSRCPKDSLSARQRGMLKRQHSIDLSDQSTNSANKHTEQVSEPPVKVHVSENSTGDCIPQPASAANSTK